VADLRRERELEMEREHYREEYLKDHARRGDDVVRRESELDDIDRAKKPPISAPSGTRPRDSRLGNIDEEIIIRRDDRDYDRDEIIIRRDVHQRDDGDFDREETIVRHHPPSVLSETSSDDERAGAYTLDVNGSSSKRPAAVVEDPAEALAKQLALYTSPPSSVNAAATSPTQDAGAEASKAPGPAPADEDEDVIHEEPEVYYDGVEALMKCSESTDHL
jgi:hypothetical protein